ncbi:UDP-4-amino-4,6-dideoxy-N-acetyl-beta-L-altrosamine transaminase [Paraglaciecola arctica]|uniref:Spore coat polysaccharide biosynthesis protein spsC n=1 Tax=Paraglaciecola arctica BSs20135 TaxID=493475 RepID=K6XJM0_9ALTE|nr:UDP-4-amino-4,6-dideoxy-N-acetyl-beta-L-altrosamine transaminase [Paraglaciecola arctica]GAC20839.1 spore coat polysaccharide biosynthesis protein spsC [Paraglaciecola arctica BSs20135]
MIPYGKHLVDEDDIDAVVDVLRNQFLTQGTVVPQFEQALCEYTKAKHCVAVNSATSGLHVACLAAGVVAGDSVWTVPNSFVASANCALYCGASIDFVDIDPDTRNIDIDALEQKLLNAANLNRLPKALILVHFSGLSCDMQAIHRLTQVYSIVLIEDAAHGLGGSYQQSKIGSCVYSDMTVLSFHPVKSITSAEGGAVLTNQSQLHEKLKLFAKHGVTKDASQYQGESHGPWYYQQIELGYNYRLSDMQAALGLSQLKKLDVFIQKRSELAKVYDKELADLPLKLPIVQTQSQSAWHLYMVELTQHQRLDVYQQLHNKGVGVNVHYIPIHLQPFYQQFGFKQGDFPVSEHFYQNALTLPLFPSLTATEQTKVIDTLHQVLL